MLFDPNKLNTPHQLPKKHHWTAAVRFIGSILRPLALKDKWKRWSKETEIK